MNEQEALLHNFKHLDFCKKLTTDGIITLDEMSELLPGTFSILDLETCAFEYVSTRMQRYFQRTMGDIIAEGADFTRGMGDLKSTRIVMQNIATFLLDNKPDKVISSFLRLRPSPKEDLCLFLVTAKSYENTNKVLIFSQRLDQLEPYSFAKEIFDFRYDFFNTHYLQFSSLTKREKEILAFVSDGLSSNEIAERLVISTATVSTHRQNISKKLGTGKLVDLIKYAIAFGLVKH